MVYMYKSMKERIRSILRDIESIGADVICLQFVFHCFIKGAMTHLQGSFYASIYFFTIIFHDVLPFKLLLFYYYVMQCICINHAGLCDRSNCLGGDDFFLFFPFYYFV